MQSWIVVLAAPNEGVVRIDVVPLNAALTSFTFKLVSSVANPPEIEEEPGVYPTSTAACEGALALLRRYCTVTLLYPQDGTALREAVGRAMLGMEFGLTSAPSLNAVVRWALDALGRTVGDLIQRGLVSETEAGSVYEALRYFALAAIVGFPVDFIPDPWLDRLPTPLLVEMAGAGGPLGDLYKAEVLRRAKTIVRWEFTRMGPYEARVRTVIQAPPEPVSVPIRQPKVVH